MPSVSLSLAEEIGERNVFNSEALRRAAAYIEAEWGALGYGVDPRHPELPLSQRGTGSALRRYM